MKKKNKKDGYCDDYYSRIKINTLDDYDCGSITAFRGEYNKADNLKRNKSLQVKLLAKNYNLTVVKGAYIENMGTADEKEVKEDTFFVVDAKEKGTLKADLKKFGEEFDQDSIHLLFVEELLKYMKTNNLDAQGLANKLDVPIVWVNKLLSCSNEIDLATLHSLTKELGL